MDTIIPWIYVFFLAVIISDSARATETTREFGPWVWGVSGGAVQQFDTDFSDGPGEFNVSRGFLQGSLGYAWDRRNTVSFSVGAGRSSYDFSSEATIDGQEPWDRVEDYRISVPVRFSPTERSDVIVIPSVRSYAQSGASLNDGRTEGVLAGISWKISDSLTIGPGVGWFSELGGGSNVFPIVVIDWKITEKWGLTTGRGMAASQGPGLTLNYQLSKKWQFGLTGRYEKTRFALDDDTSISGGFGEDQSLPLLLTLGYSPWPMTSVTAIVGAEFEGSLSLEDDKGKEVAGSDYKTAPVLGLTFSSRF
ncbi:MAG: hypothetical protein V7746_07485 [Halioglobus sp.]